MTKELAQQAQDTAVAPPAPMIEQQNELRPELQARLNLIHPQDDASLAALISQFPGEERQILAVAARQLGNQTVQRALRRLGQGKPPSAESQAEVMQMFQEVNGPPAPG